MRIGIIGVAGRVGRLLLEEAQAIGATASGTLRPGSASRPPDTVAIRPDLAALAADSDVVIDFTIASAVDHHAAALAAAGRPWVLGTSGLSLAQEALVAEAARHIAVVYSTNFSPGINLLLELASRMGAALPADSYDAEIVEMHHRQKVDAPSGTAVAVGRAVAAGRGVKLEDVTESGRDGHTGARRPGAIGFAAMRGGQVVGEHTLLFASDSEHVALTHRAFDRRIFAKGAIRAAQWVQGRPAGLYDMRDVMA
ncbi:MAG: 4-hydroxy-tetrahydrodipicolinate reductase [Janthinobacterium lividum]